MQLGIRESFALALLDRGSGRFRHGSLLSIAPALAGAVLMELAAKGRIDLESPAVSVLDSTPVGDDILDQTLDLLAGAQRTRRVGYWIRRLSKFAKLVWRDALRQLCEKGVLEKTESRIMGLIPIPRHHVRDRTADQMVRERLTDAARGSSPDASPEFSVVFLLEASGHLRRLLPENDLREARKRIREIGRTHTATRAVAAQIRQTGFLTGGIAPAAPQTD